jgi:hypothetical protein
MQKKYQILDNIKERIIYFIENEKIKKVHFFNEIGVTSANFRGNQIKTSLSSNTIEKIITLYPHLNVEWVLTGKGEMYKNQEEVGIITEPTENYNLKSEIIFAKDKTISILEREIEDLRSDKEFLKLIIKKM